LTESVVITALELNFFTLWGRTKRLISIALFFKGHWGRGRLPWEKEVGEIPQGTARGSSSVPPQESEPFPSDPNTNISESSLLESCTFVE
jgi:hypothetical protein